MSGDGYKFGNRPAANGGGGGGGEGDDEMRQIQEKIGRVENESLSSTQRALRALAETEEVGTKTAAELVNQGEKLQKIEETMDGVNVKLDGTQKNLNQLKGFFGGFKVELSSLDIIHNIMHYALAIKLVSLSL